MSTLGDALQTIERAVGYPLLERKALRDALSERSASYAPARLLEDVIDQNVHWRGERLPGDYHEDPEFYWQYVKIEQTADILARHFAGLFAFAIGVSGRKSDNRLRSGVPQDVPSLVVLAHDASHARRARAPTTPTCRAAGSRSGRSPGTSSASGGGSGRWS